MRAASTKIRRVGGAGEGRSASPRRAELCDSCFLFFLCCNLELLLLFFLFFFFFCFFFLFLFLLLLLFSLLSCKPAGGRGAGADVTIPLVGPAWLRC